MQMQLTGHFLPKDLPEDHSQFILILIAIKDYYIFKEMYGINFIEKLEHELKRILTLSGETPEIKLVEVSPGEVAFVIPSSEAPADLAYRYKIKAQNGLKNIMVRQTGLGIDLGMGYAHLHLPSPNYGKKHFSVALEKCRRMIRIPLNINGLSIANKFNNILKNRHLASVYQPIIDFKGSNIIGWEALSRGPHGSSFHSPVVLFDTAEQLGRLFALEKLCRECAIANVGELAENQKLFLNIHPKTMADPEFTPGNTLLLMEKVGLTPENVVFEITEHHSVQDFGLFYRTLDHYRNQGFRIAVDDAGAGYSGLSTIAELQPEFIKLDKSLIDDIHKDPVKRALVETTVSFADKIGSQIIAEGIEKQAQAVCLKDIGVHCGQGYFIAKPAAIKPQISKECQELQSVNDVANRAITCSLPIGDIAKSAHSLPPDYMVSDAQEYFLKNKRFSNIVVVEDDIPKGLIMEYHLNRQLSSQYGIALYSKRDIDTVMDTKPLIVDMDIPVEQVAHHAMKREPLKAYDDVIVTRQGYLYGVVTVQSLLNALAKIQIDMAKGTNPLTGLPGNVFIEQEVESRIQQNRRFSIIYADLDHFKVYNDTYGFKNGDQIIRLAADVMSWAVKKHASQDSMLCHIGGDDFVIITDPLGVDKICKSITRCFGRKVKSCYCAEDMGRGWITAKGRDGQERDYPLVSISLGVIEIFGQCSLMEIGERAAHIKKFAKSKPGNSVAVDRRPPLGSV